MSWIWIYKFKPDSNILKGFLAGRPTGCGPKELNRGKRYPVLLLPPHSRSPSSDHTHDREGTSVDHCRSSPPHVGAPGLSTRGQHRTSFTTPFHFLHASLISPLLSPALAAVLALSTVDHCHHRSTSSSKPRVRSVVNPSSCSTFFKHGPTASDAKASPSLAASSTASYSTSPTTIRFHPAQLTLPQASSSPTDLLWTEEPHRWPPIHTITGALSPTKCTALIFIKK
jgi:hypothetical protein